MTEACQRDIGLDYPDQKLPKAYPSYHIYTDGSYKKSSQAYDDIVLADNGPALPDIISAGASIIIAPQCKDWRDKQHSPLVCIHINAGSSIGAQSVYPMELMVIVPTLQLAAHIQAPTTKEIVTETSKTHRTLSGGHYEGPNTGEGRDYTHTGRHKTANNTYKKEMNTEPRWTDTTSVLAAQIYDIHK